MAYAAIKLANAVAALGAQPAANLQVGGDFMFSVNGTFGGATVTLEKLGPDGTNYISLGASAAITTAGCVIVSLPPGTYRANITGGAGPYLLSAALEQC